MSIYNPRSFNLKSNVVVVVVVVFCFVVVVIFLLFFFFFFFFCLFVFCFVFFCFVVVVIFFFFSFIKEFHNVSLKIYSSQLNNLFNGQLFHILRFRRLGEASSSRSIRRIAVIMNFIRYTQTEKDRCIFFIF